MKTISLAVLSCVAGVSCAVASGVDIYNFVHGLKNQNNDSTGEFYLHKMTTYQWGFTKEFTQSYQNGILIFGNSSQTSGDGRVWFGQDGYVGYITANFKAKEIYLTGTLGAGNNIRTGGGATLNFTSSTNANLQDWNLELMKAGTQKSHFSLTAQAIKAKNISIKNETGGDVTFKADSFDFHAKSISSHGGKVAFEGKSEGTGQIVINSLSFSGGTLDLTKTQAHTKISNITTSNTNFQSQGMNGTLTWGSFKNANNQDIQGSYEYQNNSLTLGGLLKPTNTLELKAQEVNATQARIELDGSAKTLSAAGSVRLGDLRLNNGSKATFEKLTLDRRGSITLQNKSSLTAKNLEIYGEIRLLSSDMDHTPITIEGKTEIFVGDRKRNNPIFGIYNIDQIKGLRSGQNYTLLTSSGGITSPDLGGKNLLDFVGFYEKEGGARFDNTYSFDYKGLTFTKTLSSNTLGFRVDVSNNPANPYATNRVEYWLYHRGGQDLVNRVNALGEGMMDLFQDLMMTRNGDVWTNGVIMGHDETHLVEVGQNIQDLIKQTQSLQRKANDLDLLHFALKTQKENRLAKLTLGQNTQLQREEKYTNLWGSGIAAVRSFEVNQGSLYGASIGYDEVMKQAILGGFVAYGYGSYRGGLLNGHGHNAGVGLYGRIFAGRSEIDFEVNGMMGWNQESIMGDEEVTQQLSQQYHYNARSANVNLDYGYAFGFWREQLAIKPLVSVNYAYLTSSKIDGEAIWSQNQDLSLLMGEDSRHIVSANLGLETRLTTGKNTYWWLLFEAYQDVYSWAPQTSQMRFAGANVLGAKDIDSKDLNFALSLGGEIRLFERAFVNFSVGSELGAIERKLAGNLGVEYSF
ncbi:vacuolating cytotoxin domain-containing protein [Helicobacter pametensis]|uniref:vacuolating cytotoxin domain-containing protein n=1 Tax=Helicobacter pametensis TaxID=95149 RepID=UPI0004867701|nr:vacuolating cytotoxin domain-containing protein [Helicobacter pametensis]